ncbi:MAG: glycosyltransferase family 2 protein [Candidatus Aureabacteria bacterium]|nr:glycosyltransferase family 2 protein [Candidatus Auribacterota bacterium]
MKISIIIPAYNEGNSIKSAIKVIDEFLKAGAENYEIIVVDDGSKDKSTQLVQQLAGKNDKIILLKNGANRGKGYSVKRGMLQATGDIRVFADADMSTPIETLTGMIEFVKNGYDVVIGSRRTQGAVIEIRQNFLRENMGRVFNMLVRLIVLRGFSDTQCGFKLFTKKAAENIFKLQKFDNFVFDVEILYIAKKLGFKIIEAPVKWYNSTDSKVRPFRDSLSMFLDLFKIRFFHRKIRKMADA